MTVLLYVLVALSLVSTAFAVGVLVAEWRLRAKAVADLALARDGLNETLGKINLAHNELANKVLELQEKLTVHDFKLKGFK